VGRARHRKRVRPATGLIVRSPRGPTRTPRVGLDCSAPGDQVRFNRVQNEDILHAIPSARPQQGVWEPPVTWGSCPRKAKLSRAEVAGAVIRLDFGLVLDPELMAGQFRTPALWRMSGGPKG
jgi:hypothetical protein